MDFWGAIKCYEVAGTALTDNDIKVGDYFYKAGEAHATFAINNVLGDAANEGEKVERRFAAVKKLKETVTIAGNWISDKDEAEVHSIIKEAQG